MFRSADSFNGDISSWNVSNGLNFGAMFRLTSQFNQPIGSWNTSSATEMSVMFDSATAFNQDLSSWNVVNIPTEPSGFDTGATAWVLPDSRPVWGTTGEDVDGQYQLIGGYTDTIERSTNGGVTFNNVADSRDWSALGISGTGQYALGGTFSSSTIQRSTDFGLTWSDTPYSASQVRTISISKSGQYQLYGSLSTPSNKLKISSDFGVTFASASLALTEDVYGSAISDSGQYMSIATLNGLVYTSSDYGSTWQSRLSSNSWRSITMTGDGQTQLATGTNLNVWVSTDFGVNWTEKPNTGYANRDISISSDGSVCYLVGNPQRLYKSEDLFDSGVTMLLPTMNYFVSVATSGNGQYVSYF